MGLFGTRFTPPPRALLPPFGPKGNAPASQPGPPGKSETRPAAIPATPQLFFSVAVVVPPATSFLPFVPPVPGPAVQTVPGAPQVLAFTVTAAPPVATPSQLPGPEQPRRPQVEVMPPQAFNVPWMVGPATAAGATPTLPNAPFKSTLFGYPWDDPPFMAQKDYP